MELSSDITAALNEAAAAAMPVAVAEEPQPSDDDQPLLDNEADVSEPAEDPPVAPDSDVVVPPILTEGLVAEFTLYDTDGPVEVPNVVIEYKANGKVRRDRLDQVVKLAQWGVYNEDKAARVEEVQRRADQYEQLLSEREAALERMLSDDEYYDAVREAYSNELSPERRAERAEAEAERLRTESALAPIAAQGKQFYEGELVPALDMIAQALPTVTREELEQRVEMLLRMHAVEGPGGVPIVPPDQYSAIRQAMVEDIAVWAQVTHARRQPPAPVAESPTANKELEQARVDAQRAKRAVGRAMRPVATAVTKSSPGKQTLPSTVDDAMASALENVLGGIS